MKRFSFSARSSWIPLAALALGWVVPSISQALEKPKEKSVPEWAEVREELWSPNRHSYAPVTYRILRPKALSSVEALQKLNPDLPKVLPRLGTLVNPDAVSEKFRRLYDAKIAQFKNGAPLSDHDFYDCATVLELKSGGQNVIFWQADMDVDTDGTDASRAKRLEDYSAVMESHSFLPTLSFGWAKTTADMNPVLARNIARINSLQPLKGILNSAATKAEKEDLLKGINDTFDSMIKIYGRGRSDLTDRAFPLAEQDPFIVIPGSWPKELQGAPAAVVVKNRIYPCIVADSGDAYKTGEASLRLAKAISPTASGRNRALDELGATYIIFVNAKKKSGPPNYDLIRDQVVTLMGSVFGVTDVESIHRW